LKLANEPRVFTPQSASLAGQPKPVAGNADVLAGEATDDAINCNSVCGEPFGGEFSHVIVDLHLGPVFAENGALESLDLAERDGLEPARALES
jgi:hypothetical protein